jgi:hypothetical protein
MVDDPTATPTKPKGKGGGRPSRAEASTKALRGVDLAAVDPVAVLREVMADRSAPASARVSAAKALRELRDQDPAEDAGGDINARAVAMMMRRTN